MKDLPRPGSTLRDVLPGNPDELDRFVGTLENYVDGAVDATRRIRALDSGGWVGEAADAFRRSVGEVLKRLDDAAAAFQEAAFALQAYSGTLRGAQADVRRALTLIDQADTESRIWAAKNTEALEQNFVQAATGGLVEPIIQDDPGDLLRRQADTVITEARERVEAAARHAGERFDEAAARAPDKPGWLARRVHDISDIAGGVGESLVQTGTFLFKFSPEYVITHPKEYIDNEIGIAKGLAHGVRHPVGFAKAFLDWDEWSDSPGRAFGHVLPDALALLAGGAGAVAKAKDFVEAARAARATEAAAAAAESVEGAEAGAAVAGEEAPGIAAAAAAGGKGIDVAAVISKDEANALLISKGFDARRAEGFVESFDGPIQARETRVGERFLRYTSDPSDKGSFLTRTRFDNPAQARDGLALHGFPNRATHVQEVTVVHPSLVLEGGIADGGDGIIQTVLTDSDAFEFSKGVPYGVK